MIYFTFSDSCCNNNNIDSILRKRLITRICSFIFKPFLANPDFENKFDYVVQWYIEYDEKKGYVNREIGVDVKGETIVKAPYKENLGFWCDESLSYEQYEKFGITKIVAEEFEKKWSEI